MKQGIQQSLVRERSSKQMSQSHSTNYEEKISKLKKQLNDSRSNKGKVDCIPSQFQSRIKHNSFQRMKHQLQQLQNISLECGQPCENTSSVSNGRVSVTNLSANSGVMNQARIHKAYPVMFEKNIGATTTKNQMVYKLKKMISEPNEYFTQDSPQRKLVPGNPNSRSFTQIRQQATVDPMINVLVKDESSNSCYIKPLDKVSFIPQQHNYPQSNKASNSNQPLLMNLHKKTQSMMVKKAEGQVISKQPLRSEKIISLSNQLSTLQKTVESIKVEQLHNQKSSQSQEEFAKMILSQKLGKALIQTRKDLKQVTKKLNTMEDNDSEFMIVPRQLINTLTTIFDNVFEIQEQACIQVFLETLTKQNELTMLVERQREQIDKLSFQHEIAMNKIKEEFEVERVRNNSRKTVSLHKHSEVDKVSDSELREFAIQVYEKLQMISEKESKLIKLVLAIKQSGVDIEKIYNEEVLNDEQSVPSYHSIHQQSFAEKDKSYQSLINMADHSIINDSEESLSSYYHRQINESVIESLRSGKQEFLKKPQQHQPSLKIKLDLSKIKPPN